MTKKEFLNQYRNIEIIIGSKLDELAKTRERAEKQHKPFLLIKSNLKAVEALKFQSKKS